MEVAEITAFREVVITRHTPGKTKWPGKGANMKLEGKRVAVLVENLYEDLEGWYPVLRLREEGAEVVVVGPEKNKIYHGKHGYPMRSDASSREVAGDAFDAVVVPGGYAPDMMRREKTMVDFLAAAFSGGKIVAGICHAGWMLISAGAVKGRAVTGFYAIKDDLVNAGANFVDGEVVVDGNLVTSRKPDDLPAFLRAVIELLGK